jgi:hypothetical protein
LPLSPGHHVDGGSPAEILVDRNATIIRAEAVIVLLKLAI